jgi:predicted O-linked N-acetylglucosamine transferase (SPINDLY family)
MTENTEADAIMALHKQVLVETGWECSTDSPPALKRAADTFRAEVERVVWEMEDFRAKWYQSNRDLHAAWERAERAERDNEALRSLLKEAREALQGTMGAWMGTCAWHGPVKAAIARIDALAK